MLLLTQGAGCARRTPPPPKKASAPSPSALNAAVRARGIHWVVPDLQQRPVWEMHAESGASVVASGLAELEGVRCRIYAEGMPALEAEAPRVKADYANKSLSLYGGVSARTVDGKRRFRADRVFLRVKEQRRAVVEAEGRVRLELDGAVLEGARLVTNPQLTEGRLAGR